MGFFQIARNSIRPGYGQVMLRKVKDRLEKSSEAEASKWASLSVSSLDDFCLARDPKIWNEAVEWAEATKLYGAKRLEAIGLDLGGGGAYSLLYFMTRTTTPTNVIETGVAAGWSSFAILAAMDTNRKGHLYSSDFPYFRLDNPEQYVGWLVPETMRSRWDLDLGGDRSALPRFLNSMEKVDLFHYDSDKSCSGRDFATTLVTPRMREGSFLIMDDIQDNTFFKHFVQSNKLPFWVFEFEGKYVGLAEL